MESDRMVDGVTHICERPFMYVPTGTVAEIVAWLDNDAAHPRAVRTAPPSWPQFRRRLEGVDLGSMTKEELAAMWILWRCEEKR